MISLLCGIKKKAKLMHMEKGLLIAGHVCERVWRVHVRERGEGMVNCFCFLSK